METFIYYTKYGVAASFYKGNQELFITVCEGGWTESLYTLRQLKQAGWEVIGKI